MNKEKQKDLEAIKKVYDIITKNMGDLISDILSVYDAFTEKEELNNLITMCQAFNIKATTESNNILVKLLKLNK